MEGDETPVPATATLPPAEIGGVVRIDRRTKNLTKRLGPGEIAVIHHSDLDRVSAEALVETGVSAVVNAVPSASGRYPNLGPGILLEAGIVLIDDVGERSSATVHEGDRVTVEGHTLIDPSGTVVAEGTLTPPTSWTSSCSTPARDCRTRSRRSRTTR